MDQHYAQKLDAIKNQFDKGAKKSMDMETVNTGNAGGDEADNSVSHVRDEEDDVV